MSRFVTFSLTQYGVNNYIVSMTTWQPEIESRSGPRYIAIADTLAADIAAGRLKPGDRLPTHRDLAWKLHLTVGTITRAYAEAERRGLIAGEVGRGTYIRERLGDTPPPLMPTPLTTDDYVDLSRNLPSASGPAAQMVAKHLAEMAQSDLQPLLGYATNQGIYAHREAGADWLRRRGLNADPARIAVTSGAQNAMMLAIAALCRPGDVVLVEALTFYGIKSIANLLGVRPIGVEMDDDGLLPDALEAACRQHAPKALYTLPTFQNPTTAMMPPERRQAIIEVCRRHGVTIIEDDIYGCFDPDTAPLAVLAPDITVFLTSLSKSVAPGLRIGYLHANEAIIQRATAAIRATTFMTTPMIGELGARLIRSGDADKAAAYQTELAERRQKLAARVLDGFDYRGHPRAFHIWLKMPEAWRREEFTETARRRGVGVAPANAFAVGRAPVPHAVRIALTQPDHDEELERALATLVEILQDSPEGALPMV
jgi:DNA-binding transcriptional MocR family regulator